MRLAFSRCMTAAYVLAATLLILMALTIMGWSVCEVLAHVNRTLRLDQGFISLMLQSVGAIVIAVAVIDVARYMVEEEVFQSKELRSPREAREALTKIMLIVLIAVGIEGLVYIFKAGTQDLRLLLYPSTLILSCVLIMVGMGIYQRLSIDAENRERPPASAETNAAGDDRV
jgi:hypothetical protein